MLGSVAPWLLIVVGFVFAAFAFVVAFGAPYLPTLKSHVPKALELLELKPGQTMLELGCGDGRVLIAAAEQGINAVGYEMNPLLALYAFVRTRKYGRRVKVVWGNYWTKKWPPADAIFVFLLQTYMPKLDKKIIQEYTHPVKLASFAFRVPGRHIDVERAGFYLYLYNQKPNV